MGILESLNGQPIKTKADQDFIESYKKRLSGEDDDDGQFSLSGLYSRYWMGNLPADSVDIISLASYRRAVAQFVNIATRRNDIKVVFSSGNDSYTDHKTVVLTARIKNKEFDSVVGLALHEAYHIKETDLTPQQRWADGTTPLTTELENQKTRLELTDYTVREIVNFFRNFIEDKRIDAISYRENPGYRPYYKALYDKYFNDPINAKGLKSSFFREPNLDSYQYRILNYMNKASDPNALPELDKIFDLLNFETITAFKSNAQSLQRAIEVTEIILRNLPDPSEDGDGDGGGASSSEDSKEEKPPEPSVSGKGDDGDLTKGQIKKVMKQLKKQKQFVNGKTDKKKVSKRAKDQLEIIDRKGTTITKVKEENGRSTDVVVIRDITKNILAKFPFYSGYRPNYESSKAVSDGIRLGRVLAQRLQVRNEEKVYRSKRKLAGKIDKRMLHTLGTGSTAIFETIRKDAFGEALIHISIDASGSMSGDKWLKTMTSAIALAYASDKIENLDVVISFRATGMNYSLMMIAFDSRKDAFQKIRNLFPWIEPTGTTPEGLCYEAVMEEILASTRGKTGYFINFSDGYPNVGYSPEETTRKAVEKMRLNGIKILSFFVTDEYGGSISNFKYMYGKDARQINITQVVPLAKEINRMLSTMAI